jgi:hypothetical protein
MTSTWEQAMSLQTRRWDNGTQRLAGALSMAQKAIEQL